MSAYAGMPMPQLHQIAMHEATNIPVVNGSADFWAAVPPAFAENHAILSGATNKLGGEWPDPTFEAGFKAPVERGLASIKNSEQIIAGSRAEQVLRNLATQLAFTSSEVDRLYQEWLRLQAELARLSEMAKAQPGFGGAAAARAAKIMERMEQLRLEAEGHIVTLAGVYGDAAGAVQSAGSGHSWNGPTSASAVSAASVGSFGADAGSAGAELSGSGVAAGAVAGGAGSGPPEGQAGLGQPGELGELEAERAGTGLAGGLATAPPPATIPPAAAPSTVPPPATGAGPAGVPLTPVAGAGALGRGAGGFGGGRTVPLIPAAGQGARQPVNGPIPQAAKVKGGLTSASVGRPPALPAVSTTAGPPPGPRTPSPFLPMGGAAAAGVPALLGPASGGLQGLIGRLKPVVTPPGGPGGPGGGQERVPGVPRSLRGRTTDDAMVRPPGRNRRAHDENAPETVELLDEEIWRYEQADMATETVPVRRGADRTTG